MALPQSFIEHLSAEGYHPRSNRHSNALAEAIASDLFDHCALLRNRAKAHEAVYQLNFNIQASTTWNVDLVIGTPPPDLPDGAADGFSRSSPSTIQIAIELKSVMTEHRKAVRNRARDIDAHHQHVHQYNPRTIAAGVLVINAAESFVSPLRTETTTHRNVEALVAHCIQEFRGVDIRHNQQNQGLDAACALVVNYSNSGDPAAFVEQSPAPSVGDPLHYDAFIQRVCGAYEQLWA